MGFGQNLESACKAYAYRSRVQAEVAARPKTKVVKVLFEHYGENSYTAKSPVGEWRGQVDLTTQKTACLSSDDDRLVEVDRYAVRDIVLPAWLSADEWARNSVAWGYAWARGVDPEWPESWQRGLLKLSSAKQLACARLLGVKNFRSAFRKSLRAQLESWLNGENGYDSPFSPRQWDCLVDFHATYAAKRIDENTYSRRASNSGAGDYLSPAAKSESAA
jgi:hypothetical protein